MPFESLRDPYGIAFWPTFKGATDAARPCPGNGSRTRRILERARGCRCPHSIAQLSVVAQERDPSSALHGFRRLLAWRRRRRTADLGDIEFLAATDSVLAFRRFDAHGAMLAAFNLCRTRQHGAARLCHGARLIGGHGLPEGSFASATLHLPGHGVAFFQLAAR